MSRRTPGCVSGTWCHPWPRSNSYIGGIVNTHAGAVSVQKDESSNERENIIGYYRWRRTRATFQMLVFVICWSTLDRSPGRR